MWPDTQSTVQLTRTSVTLPDLTLDGVGGTCVIISDQTSWASGQAGVCAGPTSVQTCTKHKPLCLGEEPSPDSTPSCCHLVEGAWFAGWEKKTCISI